MTTGRLGAAHSTNTTNNFSIIIGGVLGAVVVIISVTLVHYVLRSLSQLAYFLLFRRRKDIQPDVELVPKTAPNYQLDMLQNVTVAQRLGGGHFADVYKGVMNVSAFECKLIIKQTIHVALKLLRDDEHMDEFRRESAILRQLDHTNIGKKVYRK